MLTLSKLHYNKTSPVTESFYHQYLVFMTKRFNRLGHLHLEQQIQNISLVKYNIKFSLKPATPPPSVHPGFAPSKSVLWKRNIYEDPI
jgi:hypothetical protein